jgi:hypothetical protein
MSLSELCANVITKKQDNNDLFAKNIIEFATAPWGLGLGCTPDVPALYPPQRFILKTYYGLPLDNSSDRDIIIRDKFNEGELYRFNEAEYSKFLLDEGRINKPYEVGTSYPNLVLVLGRRSGKTTITSSIIAYEAYKLLNKYCPQEYYGIMPEQDIRVTCLSTSRETASELFNMVTGHIERSEFFRKYRNKPTAQWIYLRTQRDIDKYGLKGRSSLSIRVAPCSAKGTRGSNNMIVVLDEMAFFFADEKNKDAESNKDKNDKAIYKAVTPSVAKFKRKDGTPDGKVICISSPGAKSGKFYEEFERSFEPDNDLFMMQAPTWEIDSSIATQYLKNKFRENPISFKSEFGAQFSDRMFGWIDDASIVRQNIIANLKYKERSSLRVPHFMGIDVGLKHDGTAVTIGHWVEDVVNGLKVDRLEVDQSIVRSAESEGKDYFVPDEMADWMATFCDKFYVQKALMDQYYGMTLVPYLHKKGYKQFEFRQFNDQLNSAVYQVLMTDFISSAIRLPAGEVRQLEGSRVNDSDLVTELLTLQAEQKSKYMIKVSAPDRKGEHDDLSDSLARMVFLAHEHKSKSYSTMVAGGAATSLVHAARMIRRSEMMKVSLNRPTSGRAGMMGGRLGGRMSGRMNMGMSALGGRFR